MTKKKILSVALISVLTVFVFCLCFYFSGNALNQLPSITQMNYNLKSDEKPLTVKDMNNLLGGMDYEFSKINRRKKKS